MDEDTQANFNTALVTAAFPDWEHQKGDLVEHSMSWDSGGGCDTCGSSAGMSLSVRVKRAYVPDDLGWTRLPEDLYRFTEFYNDEVADIWHRVMQ
jgi:hypothetical protein